MPTYEYSCTSCARRIEVVQSFSDPPLKDCPHCGGVLKRVFHPVGIVLKGGGFYSTDNRSSRRTATKDPAKTSAEGGGGGDAGGDKAGDKAKGGSEKSGASAGAAAPAATKDSASS